MSIFHRFMDGPIATLRHEDVRWALVWNDVTVDVNMLQKETGVCWTRSNFDQARYDANNGELAFFDKVDDKYIPSGYAILFSVVPNLVVGASVSWVNPNLKV